MQKPVFTVIIATYNRKNILPRAIQSVLNQTFRDFELLVIDNGSTDGTSETVRNIKDSRLFYIRNPEPTDSCDAPRNLGIKMAKGYFIAFLDDDDIWYPERLKKVKKAFDANPDVSAVCHNEHKKVNGRIGGILRYGPWKENMYERLLYEGNCISTCGTTIKRDLLRELNGFDLKFYRAADYGLWLRMAERNAKIHFIEEPLGEFTQTGYNWNRLRPEHGADLAHLSEMHILKYENKPLLHISRKGMWWLFRRYIFAARSYIIAHNYKEALKYYAKAILFIIRRPSLIRNILSRLANERQ